VSDLFVFLLFFDWFIDVSVLAVRALEILDYFGGSVNGFALRRAVPIFNSLQKVFITDDFGNKIVVEIEADYEREANCLTADYPLTWSETRQ
jgi:hypothetical protein